MSLKFSVIYTVDCAAAVDPLDHLPPQYEELWQETEDDGAYEVPDKYAEDAAGRNDYGWKDGHHRKWCADLTNEQLEEFAKICHMTAAGEGSALGIVGTGLSRVVVFEGISAEDIVTEAFVTPHGTEAEAREWLRQQEESVPAVLTDAPGQRYLFKELKDRRSVWQAVYDGLRRRYF